MPASTPSIVTGPALTSAHRRHAARRLTRLHWREYLAEGLCLALFMASAVSVATVLQHPDSAVHGWLADHQVDGLRARIPMGLAMGLTAMAIIYSPVGQRSGAHMNPAVTLTFAWLGLIERRHVAGYVVAQFAGGLAGLTAAAALLGGRAANPAVHYVATVPGPWGVAGACVAEALMSFLLMSTVLRMSARPDRAHLTGAAAGVLVATFIVVEAPLSGMSMNLARSFASNLLAGETGSLWLYGLAPLVGMLTAARWHVARTGGAALACPKLFHPSHGSCIFCQPSHAHD